MAKLIEDIVLAPARVLFNHLDVDAQGNSLSEFWDVGEDDLLYAIFPGGTGLNVSWMGHVGSFVVELNRSRESWDPFIVRRCRVFRDIKTLVDELIPLARDAAS